jgi:hypothetical protein
MIRHALVVGFVLGAAAAARADDAKAVVEKGLKASGWDKDKSPCMTWKDKGKFSGGGMEMTYAGDWAVQLPDKYRFAIKVKFGEMDIDFAFVLNGDKASESAAGMTQDVTGEKLEYTKNQMYSMWVQSLSPLLSDAAFKLKEVPGKDVDGKPTAGVQVDREGKPTVTLNFDKASGLLVRLDYKTKNEFEGWKECTDETYLSDWKDLGGGVKVFHKMKVLRDGKPLIESEMSEFKRPEKLDPKLFEKPQ